MEDETPGKTIKLPLWKNCLEEMRKIGVNHGSVYTASFLEKHLKCKRDNIKFSFALTEIRKVLEHEGLYLTGRGNKGDSYVIIQPESNSKIVANYQRAAFEALSRGAILGSNTNLELMDEKARKRHESAVDRINRRLQFMCMREPELRKLTDAITKQKALE